MAYPLLTLLLLIVFILPIFSNLILNGLYEALVVILVFPFIVAAGLLVWFIVLAYLSVRFYDEPVRAWLSVRYKKQDNH